MQDTRPTCGIGARSFARTYFRRVANASLVLLVLSSCKTKAREGTGLLPPPPAGKLVAVGTGPRFPYQQVGPSAFARTFFQNAGPSDTDIQLRDVVVAPHAEARFDPFPGPMIVDLLSGKGGVTAGDKNADLDFERPASLPAAMVVTFKNTGEAPLMLRLYLIEAK